MPAGSTYTPIATTTLGSAQNSVSFSSLGSYTDLILVCQMQNTGSNNLVNLRFNSDSGANYSMTRLLGNGTSATSDRVSNQTGIDCSYIGSTGWTIANISIMNYGNSTTYKSALIRWNSEGSTNYVAGEVGLWRSTAAITSVSLTAAGGVNLNTGSTFTLYGIASA